MWCGNDHEATSLRCVKVHPTGGGGLGFQWSHFKYQKLLVGGGLERMRQFDDYCNIFQRGWFNGSTRILNIKAGGHLISK